VPERFAGFAKAPAVVGAWLAAHPGVTLAGWSDVSADAARVLATIVTPRATGT
jgi:hypothetical protein